jgi:hypothetical protein
LRQIKTSALDSARNRAMTSIPAQSSDAWRDSQDFSLVLGGPLFQLLRRVHLSGDALQLIRQRIVWIAAFAWLPLCLLSALEGRLWGDAVSMPFLKDFEAHIRFLVAMPLLVAAELIVHRRLHRIGQTFLVRDLVPAEAMERFDAALKAAYRLRNSVAAEPVLVALVYGLGVLIIWRHFLVLDASTWYGTHSPDGTKLTIAGTWYGYISLPAFQFLLIRWYFRLFIWARFLWQVSRIRLKLAPSHPDRLAGLGFLSNTAYAFAVLLVAHGAMVAAQIANRIFFTGAALTDFKGEIALMVVLQLCIVFGPLLVFSPQLAQAKRDGLREYGALAQRYVSEFDAKWLRGHAAPDEPLVGSADIQSLADLANSYEVVRGMRAIPVTRDAAIQLGAAVLAPIVPLALTMMPLEELLKRLAGLIF